ncbi:MAG: hypothetical protein ACE5KE_07215 [Methanosarcinales archaeon]
MSLKKIATCLVCIVALSAMFVAPGEGKGHPGDDDGTGPGEPTDQMEIHPNITEGGRAIPINGSPSEIYTIRIYNISNTESDHSIRANTYYADKGGDLEYKFYNATDNSDWLSSGEKWNWGSPGNTEYTLKLEVRIKNPPGPMDAVYKFEISDNGGSSAISRGYTDGSSIPEFTNMAIPIVSVLLIGFLMYYWKQKD